MSKEPKTYSKDQSYQKRDILYHPQFDDKGKITDIEARSNGLQVLTVEFEKLGTKKLIAGQE